MALLKWCLLNKSTYQFPVLDFQPFLKGVISKDLEDLVHSSGDDLTSTAFARRGAWRMRLSKINRYTTLGERRPRS